jgi:hypothetical protein
MIGTNNYEYCTCEICEKELEIGGDEHCSFEDHPKYTHICENCYDDLVECERCGHGFKEDDTVYDENSGCEYCEQCFDILCESRLEKDDNT